MEITDTASFFLKSNQHLPKVTQFHHSTFPQQDILWLHVSMENAMRVQIKESRDQLAGDLTDLRGKGRREEQMVKM